MIVRNMAMPKPLDPPGYAGRSAWPRCGSAGRHGVVRTVLNSVEDAEVRDAIVKHLAAVAAEYAESAEPEAAEPVAEEPTPKAQKGKGKGKREPKRKAKVPIHL
jgi:hypothetical protein